MATKSSVPKKVIFIFLMIFFIFFSTLIISEVILRFSGRVAVKGLHTAPQQIFDQIPGIFEPGQDFVYRAKPELPFHISVNSLGYRGPEITRRKPPATVRILCLGDSLTFGDFVNDDETLPYKLQELFEHDQKPVEFINGGVGGSTIVDQLYFLKKSIEISPDVVILTFFVNDIPELASTEPLYKSFEKHRRLKSSRIFAPVYNFFRDTALFQLALKVKAKYKVQFNQDKEQNGANSLDPGTFKKETELLERYDALFKDMDIYLKERSIKFMFVIFPSHHQIGQRTGLSDLQDYRIEQVERLAQGMGIPTVNLIKVFKESNLAKNEVYLIPYDGHPSKTAYAIAASAIAKNLRKDFPDMFKT